jgi:hypothetical protein
VTVAEETEALKRRFENLAGMIPENHPGRMVLQGWFAALVAQANLLLIVFNLQAIIEAKTGSDVAEQQELTLRLLEQLRDAAATAEQLVLNDELPELWPPATTGRV